MIGLLGRLVPDRLRTSCGAVVLLGLCAACGGDPVDLDLDTTTCGNLNLLVNGDFEAGSGTIPEVWQVPAGANVDFGWPSAHTHSGAASASIIVENTSYASSLAVYSWQQEVAVAPVDNERFRVRGWISTQDLSHTAWIHVVLLKADGTAVATASTEAEFEIQGTTGWTPVSAEFLVPPGTARIAVFAGIPTMAAAGSTVWFDDLELCRIDGS